MGQAVGMMEGSTRTGVLVLRAWVEGEDGLRVRVAWSTHGARAEQSTRASATVDGVCALVRAWLEGLLQEDAGQHLRGS
jgi:hypothetical protein